MIYTLTTRTLLAACVCFTAFVTTVAHTAAATKTCIVADPARGTLRLQKTPQGGASGRVSNGQRVEMIDISYDGQNRAWALIRGRDSGGNTVTGWVFREFLACD